MRIRPASAAAAFALSTFAVTGLAVPAVAQTPICDAYSTTQCPSVAPTVSERASAPAVADQSTDRQVGQDRQDGGEVATTASTLPFTGGEVVMLTVLGVGAVAGGAALVVAGRRRSADVA